MLDSFATEVLARVVERRRLAVASRSSSCPREWVYLYTPHYVMVHMAFAKVVTENNLKPFAAILKIQTVLHLQKASILEWFAV